MGEGRLRREKKGKGARKDYEGEEMEREKKKKTIISAGQTVIN